jgi:hypothetical protein
MTVGRLGFRRLQNPGVEIDDEQLRCQAPVAQQFVTATFSFT